MSRAGWRSSFGPPLIMLGSAALLSLAIGPLLAAHAPAVLAAAMMQTCPASPRDAVALARSMPASGRGLARRADRLDSAGEYVGRHVDVSLSDGRQLSLDLPAESFVAPVVGNSLVYTLSDSGRSEVHLVDLVSGCDTLLVRPKGVVRSALLDPDGDGLVVHAVAKGNRHDLGVTRYSLDGSATLVVPPLAADERFGPTFGTRLEWSTDGTTLAVQSCGMQQCRTRLLGADGSLTSFDTDGQGDLIGVTAEHLVTYAACGGLPCPVLSYDRAASSAPSVLASEAWSASLSAAGAKASLSIETDEGTIEVQQ